MRHFVPVALAGLLVSAGPASAETIRLTVVAAAPPHVTYVKAAKEKWIPEINRRLAASGKDFKIEWTEAYAQSLAKFTEVLETVEEGIAHVGLILKNFEASKLPLEQVPSNAPFGKFSMAQMVEVDRAMREKVPALNKAYEKYNQIFLASGVSPSMHLFTTFPVKTVDDLKGRKIGASGAFGQWFQGTGAVVVPSSMANSHTDIRNGVYEGYPINEILSFAYKTYQVAPHFTRVDFGPSNVSGITVNRDTWEKLPDFVKKIFMETAEQYPHWIIENEEANLKKFMGIMTKSGVKVYDMPEAERKRWAAMMPNIGQAWAERQEKRGLPGREVLSAFMGELRARNIEIARQWDKQ
jgi:TRAP-type C4-dicarboxylate transport system substrate-binding protein